MLLPKKKKRTAIEEKNREEDFVVATGNDALITQTYCRVRSHLAGSVPYSVSTPGSGRNGTAGQSDKSENHG